MLWKRSQETDELTLVQATVRGDQRAFQALVLRYEPRLLPYLIHMLGDEENARDVLQETFVSAYRALPRWVPPTPTVPAEGYPAEQEQPLAPWLYRIATNCALNFLQKSAPVLYRGGQRPLHLVNEPIDPGMSLENRYMMREILQEALRHLPPEDAACLVFRFVSGERYAEIAQRMGLTPEAVRKRVTRGILALRTAYQALEVAHDR